MQEIDHRSRVQQHYRELAPQYAARANRTCQESYLRLARRFLSNCRRLLELGSGSSDMLEQLACRSAVACDLSIDMLLSRRRAATTHCVAAAGERLPFRDACFDGLFLINVLEHVTDVRAVLAECARTLEDGGLWLAVTPNGDWEGLLDLAERWSLKIPEGPHRFLTCRELRQSLPSTLDVIEHRTFLTFPAGPPALARVIDRLTFSACLGWGFFQYVVARKTGRATGAADAPAAFVRDGIGDGLHN
jgi:ubiquinone/menaquinone biosynthesis C-methylase UbiE